MAIRVLLCDDHAVVLEGLKLFLGTQPDIQVVDEARDGHEALAKVAETRPDVVLMDLVLPGMDGVEATAAIRRQFPEVKVIVLTSFADQDRVLPALQAGAAGYLLKDVGPDDLAQAIRSAWRGQVQLHPEAARHVLARAAGTAGAAGAGRGGGPVEALTPREEEVLRLLAQGLSNKEIAARLGIAEKTVKTHVSHILGKLGLQDRTQAAVYAVRHGLVGGWRAGRRRAARRQIRPESRLPRGCRR